MTKEQDQILKAIQQRGSYETTSDRKAAIAKRTPGVFHVSSTTQNGKVIHRFTKLVTCR